MKSPRAFPVILYTIILAGSLAQMEAADLVQSGQITLNPSTGPVVLTLQGPGYGSPSAADFGLTLSYHDYSSSSSTASSIFRLYRPNGQYQWQLSTSGGADRLAMQLDNNHVLKLTDPSAPTDTEKTIELRPGPSSNPDAGIFVNGQLVLSAAGGAYFTNQDVGGFSMNPYYLGGDTIAGINTTDGSASFANSNFQISADGSFGIGFGGSAQGIGGFEILGANNSFDLSGDIWNGLTLTSSYWAIGGEGIAHFTGQEVGGFWLNPDYLPGDSLAGVNTADGSAAFAGGNVTIDPTGKVGIGTVEPMAPLQVVGGIWSTSVSAPDGDLVTIYPTLTLSGGYDTVDSVPASKMTLDQDVAITTTDGLSFTRGGNILLQVGGGTSFGKILLNAQGGYVGIGTDSPEAVLHVEGDAIVTGSLSVNGAPVVTTVEGITSFANGSASIDDRGEGSFWGAVVEGFILNTNYLVGDGVAGVNTHDGSAAFANGTVSIDAAGGLICSSITSNNSAPSGIDELRGFYLRSANGNTVAVDYDARTLYDSDGTTGVMSWGRGDGSTKFGGQVVVGQNNNVDTDDGGTDHTQGALIVATGTVSEPKNALRVVEAGGRSLVLIQESGDLSMGSFTAGLKP